MSVAILTYVRLPKRCIIFRKFQNFINPPSRNVIFYRLYLYTLQRQTANSYQTPKSKPSLCNMLLTFL